MKLDFRIDWGYQYLYSRRHYHPKYIWDGSLKCDNGNILELYQLDYPVIWYGPGQCAKETKLEEYSWKSQTKRGVSGIRVVAEVDEDTVFYLKTATADVSFRASELVNNGRIDFPIGPKYLACYISVTINGYYWFRNKDYNGYSIIEPENMQLPVHNWARMKMAWLSPQEVVTWNVNIEENSKDFSELLIHLIAMAVPNYNAERESPVDVVMPLELICDGESILKFERHYRFHDQFMQLLEDDWKRVQISPGKHVLQLKNNHPEFSLGISRIITKQCEFIHMQLSIPEWSLISETVYGKVFAAYEDVINVSLPQETICVSCKPGWNEFKFAIEQGGKFPIRTAADEKEIEIFNVCEEKNPVKVGYDMTVVPHDDNGFMDWLLDYTQRSKLGNYVLFRSFTGTPDDSSLRRWGEYCKNHDIYVSACRNYQNGVLINASGHMMNDFGCHEYSGRVYGADPTEPYASNDMKEATEKYIQFIKEEIDSYHKLFDCAAFGDASGAIRHSFLAGVDFVRAETMVSNTMTLLTQARPAAEALGKGRWGVHIAIQHHAVPYHENHLGQYFLSMMQPWMMGAELIYEEDSLFCLFKEERQAWDDMLTKGKRDMTRKFYKFVKTHPRKGKNVRKIAFLEGKYAAPFNGFICGGEQDPHYSVWGMFGNSSEEWGHTQPEKCRQLLDVLMPGASTQPLRQRFDKRRFFFAGTPQGDFDCAPVEANLEYLSHYKILLNLGWNTMLTEDYDKLKTYVQDGGILLTGLTQFSTHTKRDFLKDMGDLALINGGDLRDFCGVKVLGKGVEFLGDWNCSGRETMPEPELSAIPSDSLMEDGKAFLANVELYGAEVVAWDGINGMPMLVRNKLGKGYVYTFTIWAYPGHELFRKFCAAWVKKLTKEVCEAGDEYITDTTGEVFWTVWKDENVTRFMLLNTDWTVRGNEKEVVVHYKGKNINIRVKERTALVVECSSDNIKVNTYDLEFEPHI